MKTLNTQQVRTQDNTKSKAIQEKILYALIIASFIGMMYNFVFFIAFALLIMLHNNLSDSDSDYIDDSDEEFEDMFKPDIAMVDIDPISTVIYGSLNDDD